MNTDLVDELVSVIMPSFNSSKTIIESIDSVLLQTYENIELIICDDGSSDLSYELVQCLNDQRIKLIKNTYEKGAAGARQSCIDISNGRYIAFLDADDLWDKNKLFIQIKYMRDNNISFTYSDYYTFNENIDNPKGFFKTPESISFEDLCKHCAIGCLTVIIDRKEIEFSMINSPKEDYATWLSILENSKKNAYRCDGVVAYYRLSNNSLSSNKIKEVVKQNYVLKNTARLSFKKRIVCLFTYSINGIIKKYWKY
ncbi:glycosyltransferase family 2 protein [Aliivibrio fischeri]|uniref:Glycosyltransferase n=1 Tax=Aliivibrio fischeri TaxID=668 RepID=A0A844P140_ALIFS|nr:glycosyltransferase family 2 protein [Aliivibrio fischeri]MUK49035.1 glycosyltransferase [Aliivibrio fischeri]